MHCISEESRALVVYHAKVYSIIDNAHLLHLYYHNIIYRNKQDGWYIISHIKSSEHMVGISHIKSSEHNLYITQELNSELV